MAADWSSLVAWMTREDLNAEHPSAPAQGAALRGVLELRTEDPPRHSYFFALHNDAVISVRSVEDLATLAPQGGAWTEAHLLKARVAMERALSEEHPRDAAVVHGALGEALACCLALTDGDNPWEALTAASPWVKKARALLIARGEPLPQPVNDLLFAMIDAPMRGVERARWIDEVQRWYWRATNKALEADHHAGISRAAERAVTVRAWPDPRVASRGPRRDVVTEGGLARQERLMRAVLTRYEQGAMRAVLPEDFVGSGVALALRWDAPEPLLEVRVGPFPPGTRLPAGLAIIDHNDRVHDFSQEHALTRGVYLSVDPGAFPLRWYVPKDDAGTREALAPHALPRLAFTEPTLFEVTDGGRGQVVDPPVLRADRRYVVLARDGTLGVPRSAPAQHLDEAWCGYEVDLRRDVPSWVERELSWATIDRAPRALTLQWYPVELYPSIQSAQGRAMRVVTLGTSLRVEVAGFSENDDAEVLLLREDGVEVLARPTTSPSVVALPKIPPGRYVVRVACANLSLSAADLIFTVFDEREPAPEIRVLVEEPDASPGIYDLSLELDHEDAVMISATEGSSWWLRWEGAVLRNFGLVTADAAGFLMTDPAWAAVRAHADTEALGVLHIEAPGVAPLRVRHAWGLERDYRMGEPLARFIEAGAGYATAKGIAAEARAEHWFLPLLRLAGWAPRVWVAAEAGTAWQGTIALFRLEHGPCGLIATPGPLLYVFAPGQIEYPSELAPLVTHLTQKGVRKAYASDGVAWWCVEPERRRLPCARLDAEDGVGDLERWLEWFGP